MIAENEILSFAGFEAAENGDNPVQAYHHLGDVTGDDNEIRLKLIGVIHDGIIERSRDLAGHVQIGEMSDRQPVELSWKRRHAERLLLHRELKNLVAGNLEKQASLTRADRWLA